MTNMRNLIPTLATILDGNGLSPLHVAILNCRLNTVRVLVRWDPEIVCAPGIGKTTLHYIVDQREPLFLDMLAIVLMECLESISDLTNRFQNILMLSRENVHDRAFSMILKSPRKGALMSRVIWLCIWPGRNNYCRGTNHLHLVVVDHKSYASRVLVRRDPKLVCVSGIDGKTPLHYVVEMDEREPLILDMFGILLMECPEAVSDVTNRLQNVFMLALECDNVNSFGMLFNWYLRSARNGKLTMIDEKGNTVLHVAVEKQLL